MQAIFTADAQIHAADEGSDERVELGGALEIAEVPGAFDRRLLSAGDRLGERMGKGGRSHSVLTAANDQSGHSNGARPLALLGEPNCASADR